MLKNKIMDLIGNTPMVVYSINDQQKLYLKLEMFNPTGSVKVRPASYIIESAIKEGIIGSNSRVMEATSGNMGIALAFVCRQHGIPFSAVMPDTMSEERRSLIRAFGGEIVLSPGSEGMKGCLNRVEQAALDDRNIFVPHQFDNEANPRAHYETTGPEIYQDLNGKLDAFVAGIGSGGTITGVARYLKERLPQVKIIGVEPAGSPVLSSGHPGKHKIQGIGAGFVPAILSLNLLDEVVTVRDEEALDATRSLAQDQGILAGISSGAAFVGALSYAAAHPEAKRIVVILPDTGERYLSMGIY